VAQGVVQAAKNLRVPLVVRLAGTNVEEGRRIIEGCGLAIISADTLAEAAHKVVAAARGKESAPGRGPPGNGHGEASLTLPGAGERPLVPPGKEPPGQEPPGQEPPGQVPV
jgi:hypothetical protein